MPKTSITFKDTEIIEGIEVRLANSNNGKVIRRNTYGKDGRLYNPAYYKCSEMKL